MESLFVLIPLSLVLVAVALAVFVHAVRTRQFDDVERHALEILADEEETP